MDCDAPWRHPTSAQLSELALLSLCSLIYKIHEFSFYEFKENKWTTWEETRFSTECIEGSWALAVTCLYLPILWRRRRRKRRRRRSNNFLNQPMMIFHCILSTNEETSFSECFPCNSLFLQPLHFLETRAYSSSSSPGSSAGVLSDRTYENHSQNAMAIVTWFCEEHMLDLPTKHPFATCNKCDHQTCSRQRGGNRTT